MPAWSDPFLPAALRREPEVLRVARLTVQLSAVLIGAALAYALLYGLVIGFMRGAVILGTGAAVAAIALATLHVRPRLRAVGHVLTFLLYGVLVMLACHEGGLSSVIAPWLVTPPIFAVLLLGRRHAVGWTVLCVLTIVARHVAEASGVRFPMGYDPEWATWIVVGSNAVLVVCTSILLLVFEDIRASAQSRAEVASAALARLAYHDALTGLLNRARFQELLQGAISRALAAGDPARVAVLMLDLDGFKRVNDSLGHAGGDALLEQVARRLLNATRGCDTVARLGGDEFAVLLDGVGQDAAVDVVAQRIVSSIAAPFALDGREARIGASLGIARAAAPAHSRTASPGGPAAAGVVGVARELQAIGATVLHEADVAMYRAKALGRGRWVWHEPGTLALPMDPSAREGPSRGELVLPHPALA